MRRRPRPERRAPAGSAVDLTTAVGSVSFPNPIMTASGTAGHGAELARYFDLSGLGAVVVKSLSAEPWAGNPPLRVYEATAGMLNSVGLQGPGVRAWIDDDLPELVRTGARVVGSIWGRTVDDYRQAAVLMAAAPPAVVAVEVNLSCPNLDAGKHQFAHSAEATTEAIAAIVGVSNRPVWAKLSANVPDIAAIARAASEAGAEAVTLVNTLMAMAIDPESRRYRLGSGAGGGGLSGPAIHPVAVRAVHEVRAALPGLPIVGVGGVHDAATAVELLLAGASAVQVGTATFADPRAPALVLDGLEDWCRSRGVPAVRELIGDAHD